MQAAHRITTAAAAAGASVKATAPLGETAQLGEGFKSSQVKSQRGETAQLGEGCRVGALSLPLDGLIAADVALLA